MSRILLIILFIVQVPIVFGQEDSTNIADSLYYSEKNAQWQMIQNYRRTYPFWGSSEGVFLGIDNRYELGTYALGIECKSWVSFHGSPVFTGSLSFGYRYLFDLNNINPTLNHGVHIGFQFSFAGLETDFYFGKNDELLWTLTPKIGIDYGHISLFYGYGLPLINKSEKSWNHFHMVKLTYSINLIDSH